jgi:glycosyltransferase involved in cell wall biosynthesis
VRVVQLAPMPGYLRMARSPQARAWTAFAQRSLRQRIPDLDRALLVVSTPWWAPVLRGLPRDILCYDCIDHVSVQTPRGHGALFADWEAELLRASDRVAVVSDRLHRDIAARIGPERVFLVPNGVPEHWTRDSFDPAPPEAVRKMPRPVAGFVGALFEWVDLDLLVKVARRLPHVTQMLVGPTRRGISLAALDACANVRRYPAQPHEDVPRWIQACDACLIPFRRDLVSQCADPIKLYEYLALGKPVISTLPFWDGAPVRVAENAESFAECIEAALAESGEQPMVRKAFARAHTWPRCARELLAGIRGRNP